MQTDRLGAAQRPRSPSVAVFARKSSGIVREFSLWDAAWYGILAGGLLYSLYYVFPAITVTLPGLNLPLGYALALIGLVPVVAVYAGIGSAMPRMGGDYLFQSRTLHPLVGFSFAFAWEVFMFVAFVVSGGIAAATTGLSPMLTWFGVTYDSESLASAGKWFGTANGIVATALALGVLSFVTTVVGLAVYRTIQRWVITPFVVVGVALVVMLLSRSRESFFANFNAFHEKALGIHDYASAVRAAAGSDFVVPAFSWRSEILYLTISCGVLWYVVYSAQGLLGEIKSANNFTRLFRAFTIAGFALGILGFILPTWLFGRTVGVEFVNQYAFAYSEGAIEAPAYPSLIGFALFNTHNPLVVVVVGGALVLVGYYFAVCVFLNMTRVMCAMGLDGTLPAWFAKVSARFHAPVNAAAFFGLMSLGMIVLYRFDPDAASVVMYGSVLAGTAMLGITGLGAALFPWRARVTYEIAPVATYTVLGVPLITIVGVFTFIVAGGVSILNLVVPDLGLTSWTARALLLVSVVLAAAWFLGYRTYKKRRGVDIDLAFRQLPPE